MQVQDRLIDEKIKELKSLQLMVRDYQQSFSSAIKNMGQITIEKSPTLIFMGIGSSMKEAMAAFNQLSREHVPKFTFVVAKENHLNEELWRNFTIPEVRMKLQNYAISLVDDEELSSRPDFPKDKFQVIPPSKCVHAILKTYTNRDYSDFDRVRYYIRDNGFRLTGDLMFRLLSARNNSQQSVDYYEFWAPIE